MDQSARKAGYFVAGLVALFSSLYLPGPPERDLPPQCDISDYSGSECGGGWSDYLQMLFSPVMLGIGMAGAIAIWVYRSGLSDARRRTAAQYLEEELHRYRQIEAENERKKTARADTDRLQLEARARIQQEVDGAQRGGYGLRPGPLEVGNSAQPEADERLIEAWASLAETKVNKGNTLSSLGSSEEALAVYDEVLTRFGEYNHPELRLPVGKALLHKGIALSSLGRSEEALAVYGHAVARYHDEPELSMLVRVARMELRGQ